MNDQPKRRMVKLGKRIEFDLIREESWGNVYRCIYRARGRSYGTIVMHLRKQQYIYYPTSNIELSADCLNDIIEFLAEVNKK